MGKIIMASPKVIAVTFDQANSMKDKYNEFIKSNISVASNTNDKVEEVKTESLNLDSPGVSVINEQSESIKSDSQAVPADNNIFSSTNESNSPVADDVSANVSMVNDLTQKLSGVTLTDAELSELEDGLIEVIKIAELSIHSVIEQYREKNNKKEDIVSQQEVSVSPNDNMPAFDSGANIFDSPSEGKSIA